MKNIIVPYNDSQQSEYALNLAVLIARSSEGNLILLSEVLEEDFMEKTGVKHKNLGNDLKFRELKMEDLRTSLGTNYKLLELASFSASAILEHAQKLNAELIVMGLEQHDGIGDLLFPSMSEKVFRNSPCPVITVNHKFYKKGIKKIVFASDFEENIKIPFSKIFHFAHLMGAEIHLLFVNSPEDFRETSQIKAMMNYFSEDYENASFTKNIFDAKTKEDGILLFADQVNADLIALPSHGTSRIPLLSTSLSERVIQESSLPVMTINVF